MMPGSVDQPQSDRLFVPAVVRSVKGFTLVELLVVVAILALLMSLLMPVVKSARVQAKSSICKSNLRQLATAILSKTVSNGGEIPYFMDTRGQFDLYGRMMNEGFLQIDEEGEYRRWGHLPSKKRKSRILLCPEGELHTSWNPETGGQKLSVETFQNGLTLPFAVAYPEYDVRLIASTQRPDAQVLSHYAVNGTHPAYWSVSHYLPFQSREYSHRDSETNEIVTRIYPRHSISSLSNLSQTWMASDGRWSDFGIMHTPFRHGGRANFAYMDGHVENLGPADVYGLAQAAPWYSRIHPNDPRLRIRD